MPDFSVQNDSFGRDMMVQAFLYASGELDGTEALSFERRLGEDQAARDALCQAVLLSQPLGSRLAAHPNPTYREQVRRRLQSGAQSSGNAGKSWVNAGHPVLWGLLVAAGAALLTLALQKAFLPTRWDRGASTILRERSGTVGKGAGRDSSTVPNQEPSIGSDVPSGERLPTQDKEVQRKNRAEESRKLGTPPGQRPRAPAHRAVTN